jgi:hypothetical protein
MVGQSISHYRIAEKLAGSGMGVVYQAEDMRLRFVALTFLPEDVARNPQGLARFHCEVQAASALNHPNSYLFYDSREQDERAFAENVWIVGGPHRATREEDDMRIIRTTGQHSARGEFFCYQQFPWFRRGIRVLAGLLGIMSFAFPETIFASGADSSPTIRVRVNNYTQASPAMLAGAEREAGRILGKAGLQTVWLDCPAAHSTADPQDLCGEPLEATDIALRVLSESTQNKFQDTVFGFAVVPVLLRNCFLLVRPPPVLG